MYKNVRSSLCEGAAQDQAPCRVPPCPEWSDWNDWSPCSVTCGHGQQLRRRKCLPSGASCIGGDKEYRFCQDSICPYWDQWSPWSGCSVTCGIGTCERRRKCALVIFISLKNCYCTGAVIFLKRQKTFYEARPLYLATGSP
ncbi:unnamed protein product [Toxocara canis]|uniref:TSP1_spondin domain-containing protein n=1 Tax=Toxocara canis TaxID=6265 RepID=A0A183U2F8_TOXCA|nr:unnamed protein product [Toxocara canis]